MRKKVKKVIDKRNEDGAAPCKHCRLNGRISYPEIKYDAKDDIWYSVCPNCHKYDTYDFIAVSKKRTIENWNDTMESVYSNGSKNSW